MCNLFMNLAFNSKKPAENHFLCERETEKELFGGRKKFFKSYESTYKIIRLPRGHKKEQERFIITVDY